MPAPVWLPRFDPSNEESRILRWLVSEGERVSAGDALCEVETDKVNMEIEAPSDGLMGPQRYPDDTVVPATTVIAWILGEGEQEQLPPWPKGDARQVPAPPRATATMANATDSGTVTTDPVETAPVRTRKIRATPAARHLARSHRVDLARLNGSGPRGRIQVGDVRQASARDRSVATSCLEMMIDLGPMDGLLQLWPLETAAPARKALLLRACVLALASHPGMNSVFRDGRFVPQDAINPGMIVPMDNGQIEAVLRGAEKLDMHSLLQRCEDLDQRARSGNLAADERAGESFRLCDMGELGIHRVLPQHRLPAVASLGVGRAKGWPLPDGARVAQRGPALTLTLVLAGGPGSPSESDGARFLKDLGHLLERPVRLLLQGGT